MPLTVAAEQHQPIVGCPDARTRGATEAIAGPTPTFGRNPTEGGATWQRSNRPPPRPGEARAFVFRAVDEVGATLNAALVVMGDRLGLYRALAGAGPLTPAELAERTGTGERYVREWLNAQAAGGYVDVRPGERPLHAAARAGASR